MAVIAVVNRKGGSGKSTLATHLAACLAHAGHAVMLGDVDRQQSTQSWLRARRRHALPGAVPIVGWAVDPCRVLRPPAGVDHVVLDTPGGLRGFDLARVAGFADVILMPVCHSVFDRESAADCHAELMALPRVDSGRCRVAAVGMRIDARTRGAAVLAAWAAERSLPLVGMLREAQVYVRSIEQGLTVFDLPSAQVEADRREWRLLVDWLEPALRVVRLAEPRSRTVARRDAGDDAPAATQRTAAIRTVIEANAAPRAPVLARTAPVALPPAPRAAPSRWRAWFAAMAAPRFLTRST